MPAACCFLLTILVQAIGQEFTFDRITSANGLSQNNVMSIFQDSDGYMWFCTFDGLNRYEGYEFKIYRSNGQDNSLSSNLISNITEDKEGNLWISTFDNGICKFNKETEEFTQFQNTPETPDLLVGNSTRNLFVDSKNNLRVCNRFGH